MNYKNTNASRTTITRDINELEEGTGNIYRSIVIMAKRANQIQAEMKAELNSKLEEFATTQDTLEEVFENREQIEISKMYERLPKPHSIAIEELLNDEIYFRQVEEAADEGNSVLKLPSPCHCCGANASSWACREALPLTKRLSWYATWSRKEPKCG